MKEKILYILLFILSVIILGQLTISIVLVDGPSFSVIFIPIVLICILLILSFIKKKKKLYHFMLYVLLFILSVTMFFVVTISFFHKDGPYNSVFIPIVLLCMLVFIISFIKEKKEIYYFMLYMLLFYILSIIIGILLIISISIFIQERKQVIGEVFFWILEMCFFAPYIFSIIIRKYKLALQPENTLLKADLKKSHIFLLISTVLTVSFNLLISFYGN